VNKKHSSFDIDNEPEPEPKLVEGPYPYESAEEFGGRVARELIKESIESRQNQ